MAYKLSPSKIHFISQCKLRFVLSSKMIGESNRSKVFNQYSFLGILIHSVVEKFVKENIEINEFEDVWSYQLNNHIVAFNLNEELKSNLTYILPYYVIKKEKTRNYIAELFKDKKSNLAAEVPVKGEFINGFADLIEDNKKSKIVKIIDLKTGPIWELSCGEIVKLKEGYRIQLLTYGTSYWENGYQANDITCTVQGLSLDERISLKFKPEEYEAHQNYLNNLLEEIKGVELSFNVDSLANPSVEACKYCEHTLTCSKLHNNINDDNMLDAPFAIIDEINCEFDDLNSKINITTNEGVNSIHRIPINLYAIIKDKVRVGSTIFVRGLYVLSYSRIKYWTRHTDFKSI